MQTFADILYTLAQGMMHVQLGSRALTHETAGDVDTGFLLDFLQDAANPGF